MALINISVNQNSSLLGFLSPIIGVIISAFIAWLVYRKQLIEKDIKENISKYFYIFSLIAKNFEELSNIKYQISQPALEELNKALGILDQVEKLLDWETGRGPCPISIIIDENNKSSYIKSELKRLSKLMSMSISTRFNFLFIDKQSFEKEASLLTYFGDTNFQFICNRLHTSYNVIDDIQNRIRMYYEENIEKPRSIYKNVKVVKEKENYKEQINITKNQLLYREAIFKSYDDTVNRALIYSYNALNHLETFFNKYQHKYKVAFKVIGIPYKNFSIEHETLIAPNDFWKIYSVLIEYEYPFFALPIYYNLKRTFLDKLSDLIFYGKWS